MHRLLMLLAATVSGFVLSLPAHAIYSRTINVPMSANGQSAIVDGNAIKGIYLDLLIPASKIPKRDAYGCFVPPIRNRAMLITLSSGHAPIKSTQDLLAQTDLKIVLVRGFDDGPAYQELITTLTQQGRLILEVDALSVARLLKSGAADATIMAPSILAGALQDDERAAKSGVVWKGFQQYYAPAVHNGSIAPL